MKYGKFIIIDDDAYNNKICRMIIRVALNHTDIEIFEQPERALEYIKEAYSGVARGDISVTLLDINMPTMTGWEFLDEYEKLDESIRNQIRIFVVSSSVDLNDITRAKSHPEVIDFLSKPLSKEALREALREALSEIRENEIPE